jgi:hypothetical protein
VRCLEHHVKVQGILIPSIAPGKAEIQLLLSKKEMLSGKSVVIEFLAQGISIQESQLSLRIETKYLGSDSLIIFIDYLYKAI